MSRPLRINYPGALYHLTARGNAREAVFRDDEDRLMFLAILGDLVQRYNLICHGYCLMGNHYHLLIETPDGNLSEGMRQLNGIYTQRFNRRQNLVGHLFQGRYKSILVERDGYLLELCRYIVLNPVRAKMANHPKDYPWSSFNAIAGHAARPDFLSIDWILNQFGGSRKEAQQHFADFVLEGVGGDPPWNKLSGQCLLGGEKFIDELLPHVRQKYTDKEIPRNQRFAGRPLLVSILPAGQEKSVRNRCIAEAHVQYGYSQQQVAAQVHLHYSTVSRIIQAEREASEGYSMITRSRRRKWDLLKSVK